MRRMIRLLLAGWMAAGIGPRVHAENLGSEEAFFAEIPIVFAASKRSERVVDAPANTIVVTGEEIRARGYRNLKDVLADLPGMEVIEMSNSETGTMVPVRGLTLSNNKTVVLINGMRVNPPGGEAMMFRNDQSVRFAKRVEVVYGPGSALYGADAVNAVINIVTEDVADAPLTSAMVSGGTENTAEGSLSFGHKFKEARLNTYAQYYRSDETDYSEKYKEYYKSHRNNFNTAGPSDSVYERWNKGLNIFSQLAFEGGSIQYWYRDSSRSSSQANPSTFPYVKSSIWRDSSHVLQAQNKKQLTDNVDLSVFLTYNLYEINPQTAFTLYQTPALPALPYYDYSQDKWGRGSQLSLESRLDWHPSEALFVTLGAEASDNESSPKATTAGGFDASKDLLSQSGKIDYYLSAADRTADINKLSVATIAEMKYRRYGLFTQAKWKALDKLQFVLGGRFDKDSRFSNTTFNPRASAIYSVSDRLTLKYIFGTAYVAQPMYFTYNVFTNTSQLNLPNLDLKPEKAMSNEVNLVYTAGTVQANVGAYYNRQKDLFRTGETVTGSGSAYLPGTGGPLAITTNINLGDSVAWGLDSLFKFKLRQKDNLFLAASFVDATFNAKGLETGLDKISALNARVGATVYAGDRFFISPRFSWRSNPHLSNGQPATNERLASGALINQTPGLVKDLYQLDLYGGYHVKESVTVFSRLSNVTNHKYALRGSRPATNTPAELFRAEVGAEWRL
jgi:outer membrane receptor for ferrienterochelin and colicin